MFSLVQTGFSTNSLGFAPGEKKFLTVFRGLSVQSLFLLLNALSLLPLQKVCHGRGLAGDHAGLPPGEAL